MRSKKKKFNGLARLNICNNIDRERKRDTIKANLVFEVKNISSKKQKRKKRQKNKAINQMVGGKIINKKTIKTRGIKNKGFFLDISTN